MARLHILESGGMNIYTVIVHAPTPNGNNSAGVSWATAIQNSGSNITQMTVGNGPGQITNSEANQVTAGTVIEAPFQWGDDPNWTNQERQNDLAIRATQAVNAVTAELQTRLKYYGHTVT